ncbi:hypothetical protein ACLB2K_048689 [Fragaria x ananassa]
MVKSTERVCHYKALGLEPNCTYEQIKAAHRKLILIYHWDKCRSSQSGLSQDEATAKFLQVREAYETLMDHIRREAFDAYRQTYAVPEVFNPDLEIPFDNVDFNGYSSSGSGFYKVYSDLFQRIYANERAYQKKKKMPWNSVNKPPEMGNLDSSYPEVVQFYNYWLNFGSIMDFCWEDPHDGIDISKAGRKGCKFWSRINMKARKKAKKEYNNKVRGLAQNAKRLDKRIMQMMKKREEERKREIEEEKERRKQLKKEKLDKAMEKAFRSEKQCRNHEQSRKHLRLYAKLMELLSLEEECNYEEHDEEEVLKEAKRNEVIGGSDSEDASVNDSQREKYNEEGEVDDEEVEVEDDEMDVLEAMVAKRKTMEKVSEDIHESVVEPLNNAEEVAMEYIIKNTDKNGERKSRRRAKSTGTNERRGSSSNMKEAKPDSRSRKGKAEGLGKKTMSRRKLAMEEGGFI